MSDPTRNEVARAANVSTATVSRVYNQPESVSSKKRQAVLAAAAQLGYSPNKHASSLRRAGSSTILLLELKHDVVNFWTGQKYFAWLFADALRTTMDAVGKSSFHLNLESWSVGESLDPIIRKHRPAGIITFDLESRSEARRLEQTGVPYVIAWHVEEFDGFNRVCTDNRRGGYVAGEYLAHTGHRRPAFVTIPSLQKSVHDRRLEGFCEAFEGYASVSVFKETMDAASLDKLGAHLAGLVKNGKCDSVGAVNDVIALRLYHALRTRGIRIPEQVSIIGYDNLPVNIALPLSLASVDLCIDTIYRQAVESLLAFLTNGKKVDETCEPVLVEGTSVLDRR